MRPRRYPCPVISPFLAQELRTAGLPWDPAPHDVFMIPDRNMDGEVFVISQLTIDVDVAGDTPQIMFNGAVEWSLDHIVASEVVWLPREAQLRAAMAGHFVSLTREPGGYRCRTRVGDEERSHEADDAADAYALALLDLLLTGALTAERARR